MAFLPLFSIFFVVKISSKEKAPMTAPQAFQFRLALPGMNACKESSKTAGVPVWLHKLIVGV